MTRLSILIAVSISAVLPLNSSASKKIVVPKDYSSVQTAIEKGEPGDTVYLLNGTYSENVVLRDDIKLVGESIDKTIIKGNTRSPVIKTANGSTVSNLTVENGSEGIICENTSAIIEHVAVRGNKGTGIHCLISLPDIRNCLIYKNKWTGIYCESVRSIKTAIRHNIIAENGYSGIMLSGRSEVLIENNVLYSNKQYGVWASEDSKRSRITYNNIFDNRTAYNFYAQVDRTNISEDPSYGVYGSGSFDYIGAIPAVLKGKGRDGVTIGMISQEDLSHLVLDPDGDGVTTSEDKCSSIAEDKDGFEDDDGCPDFDNDNDGIYDTQDKCPNEAEDIDGFMDDDGCPDLDNDKDGILDKNDNCPMNPETVNGYKDDDGCPDAVPASGLKQPSGSDLKKAAIVPAVNENITGQKIVVPANEEAKQVETKSATDSVSTTKKSDEADKTTSTKKSSK